MRPFIYFLCSGLLLLAPLAASAQGLVPCNGIDCQACNVVDLLNNIISFLIGLSIPIAMGLFAYAGILYFTSNGDLGKTKKARGIFVKVFIGIVIALLSYVVVETVLHTILSQDYWEGWNKIQCVSQSQRPTSANIGDLLGQALTVFGTGSSDLSSSDAQLASIVSQAGVGNCSAIGGLTPVQSCIARHESSCNNAIGSSVDVGSDGTPVSWGLYQINLSSEVIRCSNINGGQPLNCPSAFGGGAYTGSNHATYVKDQALFERCRAAAQDVQCSAQVQTALYQSRGLQPWGTAARSSCAGI